MQKTKEFLEQENFYKKIECLESEIKTLKHLIENIGNEETKYFSVFPLNKDDYIALLKLREQKLKNMEETMYQENLK